MNRGSYSDVAGIQDDAHLQDFLTNAGAKIKTLTGKDHQAYSDEVYSAISQYAANNPGSTLAQSALTAAHDHAPSGHVFPKVGPQPATPAAPAPAANFPAAAAVKPAAPFIGPVSNLPTPAAPAAAFPAFTSSYAAAAAPTVPDDLDDPTYRNPQGFRGSTLRPYLK